MTQVKSLGRTVHYVIAGARLGWEDIRDTYRRSTLGPFWISVGLAVQIAVIATIFGFVLDAPLAIYLPFVASGFVVWSFMTSAITEASSAYLTSQVLIKQFPLPSFVPIVRVMTKNLIIFLQNIAFLVLALMVLGKTFEAKMVFLLPAFFVISVCLYPAATLAAFMSARFRDVPPIIGAMLTVAFYLTPVIWLPEQLPTSLREIVVPLNPFFHLIQLIRLPLEGSLPSTSSWVISISLALVLGILSFWVSRRFSWKIVYWL